MSGAMRADYGSLTEAGAGAQMDRRQQLQSAVTGFAASGKSYAAAKQITRNRSERQAQNDQRQMNARKQALLEMMHAHIIQRIPLDQIAGAVSMGADLMPPMPTGPMGPPDNLNPMQPPGMPLSGAMGQ